MTCWTTFTVAALTISRRSTHVTVRACWTSLRGRRAVLCPSLAAPIHEGVELVGVHDEVVLEEDEPDDGEEVDEDDGEEGGLGGNSIGLKNCQESN